MAYGQNLNVLAALHKWWSESVASDGVWTTGRKFSVSLWTFLRESTPAHRRQRYGDVDYDWDYRVDTTSATVNWRERLLGQFHSPYQPTEPGLFKEMMAALKTAGLKDFQDFTFIDVGSGKGRVLLMAADYPFRRIIGVELFPDLHRIAQDNVRLYNSDMQQCFRLEPVCADARGFAYPVEPLLLYLFNPLPEPALKTFVSNLEASWREHPRDVYVLYHNPLLEQVLRASAILKKVGETPVYSIFHAGAN